MIDANANDDKVAGNVSTFSRAGKTTDANGDGLNIDANELMMISKGDIGTKVDPIEISSKTQINKPVYTSFIGCTKGSACTAERYIAEYKAPKPPKK